MNKADPLTQRDTDVIALNWTKLSSWEQQLIPTDHLDPQIMKELEELKQVEQAMAISPINLHLDLVDSILCLNWTSLLEGWLQCCHSC